MMAVGRREITAAIRVMMRGQLARYGGPGTSSTLQFEQELSASMGVKHSLAVNSGTSALICALAASGIGPGDEVLVPAYTWVSSAAAPLAVGAVPILVEINESLTIDPVDLKAKITPYTKAIIPVHMLNVVCDMDPILQLAAEFGLVVVEDACQAIGAQYKGQRVGSIGNVGTFSFQQNKNLVGGEGGAVLTNDARLFARAGMYHDVGSYTREQRFSTDEPLFVGLNLRMPEMTAAILRPQLKRLDKQLAQRRRRRLAILEEISNVSGLVPSIHHSPMEATGLTISAEDVERAKSFAAVSGVNRLIETGRHVYSNWQSILAQRSFDPRMDPYKWAHRTIEQTADCCPRTLSILERSCSVSCDPQIPMPMIRRMARELSKR